MLTYFLLQFKMTNRKVDEFGLPPILAYILLIVTFIGLSSYLFSKTEYAHYIYVVAALGLVLKFSETKRNDFLKICFRTKTYFKVRIIENSLLVLPFAIYMISEKLYFQTMILFVLVSILAFLNFNTAINFTIPTPFGKKPFEFTRGFRNTFFVFPIAYFITYIAISLTNFNLGVFSLLLIFMVVISYYNKLENEMYIWCFNQSSKTFLIEKIKTSLLFSTILSVPSVIALAIFFPSKIETILLFWNLAYLYLSTIVLAKYASYPSQMDIPQVVLIALSLIFPPLLIGLIPYFYLQSIKRLNSILE